LTARTRKRRRNLYSEPDPRQAAACNYRVALAPRPRINMGVQREVVSVYVAPTASKKAKPADEKKPAV
jgi:hypothetical protein